MNRILILGAGMIVKPMVHYLLDRGMMITMASRTKAKAEKVLEGYSLGRAIAWTADQTEVLEKLINQHDIIVSLLPYSHHVAVAKRCIDQGKNMLTTSYVSPQMKALDKKATEAGILILNEMGVDPGYDHMTAMDLLKALHLTGEEELDLAGKKYAQVTARLNGLHAENIKEEIKKRYHLDENHPGLTAIEWLGVLDSKPVPLEKGSPIDLTSDLMIQKMMMEQGERDMVIMQHIFHVTRSDGRKEQVVARMLNCGNSNYTSIARTVALPAAIGVMLILEGLISDTGVHIPIKKSIYEPVLAELRDLGISMSESVEEMQGVQ